MSPLEIERKWQSKWESAHLFESTPSDKAKFFATYPYSYMNGIPHIGHAFTSLRVEFICRFKRMRGENVLFPFAFHCTGMPIVAAAKRIKEGEEGQISIMKTMGISDADMHLFTEPEYWTRYFPARWEEAMRRLGMSIDWRRKFITTPLNPFYDAFVRWQFKLLLEGNYIRKGSHPVIWCPRDGIPVGDHDRRVGEGEVPVEYTLLKFKREDGVRLVAATLRPETAFGQTNLWVNPNVEYVIAEVDGERWVVSREAALKLAEQQMSVKLVGSIRGDRLVGDRVYSPTMKKMLPVLPASFPDPDRGTGIVCSVPADSPDDYVALMDLKKIAKEGKIRDQLAEMVSAIRPIETIETPGWGRTPGVKAVEKYKITSQAESEKLKRAREEIYREGYYHGVMLDIPGYAGMSVVDARQTMRKNLIDEGEAATMYEPSGLVICRCLTKCIVKIVENQWFIAYGDPQWKDRAHYAVSKMEFIPPFIRRQFDNTIDWLRDWACVHHSGLGTELPWDPQWKIESLSDSTIYMAYYTVAHYFSGGVFKHPPTEELFNYVFLGKGNSEEIAEKEGVSASILMKMREEFLYWYPVDLRVSGKDLIGNHLTFSIFNHTAIFPEEHWTRAYSVNGWITRSGSKMSKSAGNIFSLQDAIETYGADVTRITEAYADEGFDDPNWDDDFATSATSRLAQLLEFATEVQGMEDKQREIDAWLRSVVGIRYGHYLENMEKLAFKESVRTALLDLQNDYKWYIRRCGGKPSRSASRFLIEMQTLMLAPFTPHICEEIWERLGHKGFVSTALLPSPSALSIDKIAILSEEYLKGVLEDIEEIGKARNTTSREIFIYVAAPWKKTALLSSDSRAGVEFVNGPALSQFYKRLSMEKKQGKLEFRKAVAETVDELNFLKKEAHFISAVTGASVTVAMEEHEGPGGEKRHNSFPGRPAIYVS
ncbi:MAG: leucine--tRNA ligase [Methanomassiliicoccales archaeon]